MQLSFDPRDRNACTSVIATIAALHGSLPFDEANANGAFGDVRISGSPDFDVIRQADRLLDSDAPDPAEAFGGVSPETAFAGNAAPNAPAPSAGAIAGNASLPNPGGVEVDSSGLPWDGRIHSGPSDKKPMNGDRTWRRKRGATDDEVRAVEAELRAALNAPVVEVPAPPVPLAVVPAPPASVPAAPVQTAVPAAPVPTPPVAVTVSGPAAATPAASVPATTFAELMRKITSLQAAGALTVEGTAEISGALGISGVRDLIARPDLVPSFDALLPAMPAA